MFNNKKAEMTFSMIIGSLLLVLILSVSVYMFSNGAVKPWSKTISCESHDGVWSKGSCEPLVSFPYPIANSKDHEKENCCIPISGKEKEFDAWKKTMAANSGGEGEVSGSDTVSLEVAGKTLLVGNTAKVEAGKASKIQVVKNMDEGDFCVISVNAAKIFANSIIVDDSGKSFSPVNYDSCGKGKVLDYGEKSFSKGLYIIKVEVYDKFSKTKYGPYISYINATEPEPADSTKNAKDKPTTEPEVKS